MNVYRAVLFFAVLQFVPLAFAYDEAPQLAKTTRTSAASRFGSVNFKFPSGEQHAAEVQQVTDAFHASKRPDERVTAVEFQSATVARVWFSTAGMHGGVATLSKEDGVWRVSRKGYLL